MEWLWPAAAHAGVPVALAASAFIPVVGQIAERHPGVKLIVDHFGRGGGGKDEAAFANLGDLLALAKYPNVAVKATGAPSYSSASYPFSNIHDYLHQVYDAFGPQRMFWGTDITRMPCSWRQCVTLFTEETPLAFRKRQGAHHGSRALRVAGLGYIGVSAGLPADRATSEMGPPAPALIPRPRWSNMGASSNLRSTRS